MYGTSGSTGLVAVQEVGLKPYQSKDYQSKDFLANWKENFLGGSDP